MEQQRSDRAIVFKADEVSDDPHNISRKMPSDPFIGAYGEGILEPPYNLSLLSAMPEHNNILGQCVEAMETNIDGFGYELVPSVELVKNKEGKFSADVEAEKVRVENFFGFCNPDIPYSQLCRRKRKDLEATGNAYWEIIRDASGVPCWIEHIESYTMRLSPLDKNYTEVKTHPQFAKIVPIFHKRFRRFIQIRSGVKVFFKTFGDPRHVDARDGKTYSDINRTPKGFVEATEIIHFKIYSPSSEYGAPRWMGNFPSAIGSRYAEEVNLEYFDNNTIPPLALLVSGQLSKDTADTIRDFIQDHAKGRKSFNKMLVIEASPVGIQAPGMHPARAELHFEKLSDAQQKDSLFDNYDRNSREKIRSAFRLPPIYVGLSEDYTRATAESSRKIAEQQVFAPERDDFDFVINRFLLPALGVRYWRYKSLSPTSDDSETLAEMLNTFADTGMTVRECRKIMEEILNEELTGLPEDLLDVPVYAAKAIALQGAGEAHAVNSKSSVQKNTLGEFFDNLIQVRDQLSIEVEKHESCNDERVENQNT